ncbi:MAG: hypothetical protein ABFD18_06615 [Syntrophomonas sp.]
MEEDICQLHNRCPVREIKKPKETILDIKNKWGYQSLVPNY